MNKGDLIEAVASELKISKTEANKAVDAVLESITKGLKTDAKVNIVGFGTFNKRNRRARQGINPTTREPIQIPPSISCGFKPSSHLKELI